MVEVNKLNGTAVFVNPDLIRFVEAAGDTVLVFVDGEKLIVRQRPDEVIARIIDYRRECASPTPAVTSAKAVGF